MNATAFVREIMQGGNPLEIEGRTVIEPVSLTSDILAAGVVIKNCTFNKGVFFEGINLNCGIKFEKCVFRKNLSFTDCKAGNYDGQFNFDGFHLVFDEVEINEGLFFNGVSDIDRGVLVKNKSVLKKLQVRSIVSKSGSFNINNSTIEDQCDIEHCEFSNGISFGQESSINSKVRISNNMVSTIGLVGTTFKKDFHLWAGKVVRLIFNNGTFYDDLYVHSVPIESDLSIIGVEFKKSMQVKLWDETNRKLGSLNKVYIASSKFGDKLVVLGNNERVEKLEVVTSQQLEGDIYFNSCQISETKITGDIYKSNIVFNHTSFNNLSFDYFNNYSTLSIISAKSFEENSRLSITHSNIGKAHLFNVFLDTFDNIEIFNSILTDISVANVKWFKDSKLNNSPALNDVSQKKEIYRQLKFALEKQGDRISSLKFKSLEMKAFKDESFLHIPRWKRIFNVNRFILWLGKTNNYGQNWFKPVLLAIGFTLLFYFLIVVGISEKLSYVPNFSCKSISTTCSELWTHCYAIPQLMNPTHALYKVFPNSNLEGFSIHFWDYTLKLFLAFFIFQTVSAFRKYMK